jgi:hypothetical protein
MSYKFTPPPRPEVLSQEEVDRILKRKSTSQPNGRALTHAEKLELEKQEREWANLQRKFKKWEKAIKEWEAFYTPDKQIEALIQLTVSRFSEKELGRRLPIYEIYDGFIQGDTFTVYSYVVKDFVLPKKFYVNEDGKQFKVEIELKPLSHSVELITRGGGGFEMTFPLQKTVYKIIQVAEYTKEMREGDSLKNAISILSLLKPEMIPSGILSNIHFIYDLSPRSKMNPELMLKELNAILKRQGEFYFRSELDYQLQQGENGLKYKTRSFSGYSKDRTQFVLDQAEIYENSLKAS